MYKLLITLLGTSLLFLSSCQSEKESKTTPNIIVILADDLGYGDLSCYNPEGKISTPDLDRIASEGISFRDAHTSSSVCTPTRYGLLTGRYNWRTRLKQGVLTGISPALIPDSRATIASVLKEEGYHTGFIGKWHLGWDWTLHNPDTLGEGWNAADMDNLDFTGPITHTPNDLGFDYAYGHSGSLDMAPYVYVQNGKVTALPDTVTVSTSKYDWWREGPTSPDFKHSEVTPHFFKKAKEYILDQTQSEKPFFLYLALPSPHTPILPTPEWQGKSGLNPYADFVMMLDDAVGSLDKLIDSLDLSENTILLFTSDNGCSPEADLEELQAAGHYPSGPYRGHKADIYEGGHRVPFIVKWPGQITANSTSDRLVCTTDLLATFAAITGKNLKEDEGEDSYNFVDVLLPDKKSSLLREAIVNHSIDGEFAIRKGKWKLIFCPGSGGWSYPTAQQAKELGNLPDHQLFDLSSDPSEQNNIIDAHPDVVEELTALMNKYIDEGRSTPGSAQENDDIDFEWKQIKTIRSE